MADEEPEVELFFLLHKSKPTGLELQINGKRRLFAPNALVPLSKANSLLTKQVTVGGCCNKPQKTMFLFATSDQLESGERAWIT